MAARKPLRVLILSHSAEFEGAERSMFDLLDYWTAKGLVEPHLIIRKPPRAMMPELRVRGWNYTALRYGGWAQRHAPRRSEADKFRNSLYNSRAVFAVEKLIGKFKPDVVMTNTIICPWAAIAAHLQRVPHVWFVREYGYLDEKPFFETSHHETFEDVGTLSNLVVTNSQTLARYVAQHVDETKIQCLYNPFKIEALEAQTRQATKSPFKNPDSLKLLITGRIAPSKGQFEAARAVGRLNRTGYDTELCVIGEPSHPEDAVSLQRVIDEYGIADKVHFLGRRPHPLAFAAHADVGIMASRNEAFGRVTFEYMVAGLAVVGSNSGATPEMIEHGKNGFIYESRNVASLVKQLKMYARNRSLAKKHGQAARQKARAMMRGQYNADALYERVKAVVRERRPAAPLIFFSRLWLDYPLQADRYIQEAGAVSLRHIVYTRLRGKAKGAYHRLNDLIRTRKKG